MPSRADGTYPVWSDRHGSVASTVWGAPPGCIHVRGPTTLLQPCRWRLPKQPKRALQLLPGSPDLHTALACTHCQSQRCRVQAAWVPPAASGAQPDRHAARWPACHSAAVCRWHQDHLEWRAREHARLREAGLLESGDEASSEEEGGSPCGCGHSPRRLQGEADRALVRQAGVTLEQRASEEARHDARKVNSQGPMHTRPALRWLRRLRCVLKRRLSAYGMA